MLTTKALRIVLSLAVENALDKNVCDPELYDMADEQAEALDEIESLAAKLERQTMNTEQVNRVNRRKNRRTLRLIHEVLSGNEWSADTAGEIAEIMVNAGFEIKEPESE